MSTCLLIGYADTDYVKKWAADRNHILVWFKNNDQWLQNHLKQFEISN